MALKRVEVHYSGRVQGVGFRFTVERFAAAYKVVGYVRNMADGRVGLAAEGEEETLKEFLDAIRQDMGYLVSNYTINWFPPTGEFKHFMIKF